MESSAIQLFGGKAKRKRPAGDAKAKPTNGAVGSGGVKQPRLDGAMPEATPAPAVPERAQGEASTSAPGPQDDEEATFKDLGLSDWLCGVLGSLGISRPTPVQRGTIPAVLQGRDVIGTAQTGSGKTAAFALPILQKLARDPYGVFVLVLTPTRCAGLRRAAAVPPAADSRRFTPCSHCRPPARRLRPCRTTQPLTAAACTHSLSTGSWLCSWRSSFVPLAPA